MMEKSTDILSALFGEFRSEALMGALPVILFGAGATGGELCSILRDNGVKPSCFCDNAPSRIGSSFCELPVIALSQLESRHRQSLIVVATRKYAHEIRHQLEKAGFSAKKILSFPCKDFMCINYSKYVHSFRNPIRPDDNTYYVLQNAKYALMQHDYGSALSMTNRCLVCNNALPEAHLIKAIALDLTGEHDAAITHYRKVIQYNGYNFVLHSRIWNILYDARKGRVPEWYFNKRHFLNNDFNAAIYQVGDYTYFHGDINVMVHTNDNTDSTMSIGKYCSISNGVTVFLDNGSHDPLCISTYPFRSNMINYAPKVVVLNHSKGDVNIGNDVWIGRNATVLSGVNIGNGVVIGAESVVTKDVPSYSVVAGNPAVIRRKRFDDSTIDQLSQIKWWDWEPDKVIRYMPLFNDKNRVGEFIELHGRP